MSGWSSSTGQFARGIPPFCDLYGLACQTHGARGPCSNVMQDELYASRRGSGATLNGEPIRVSGISDISHATGGSRMVPARLPVGHYTEIVEQLKDAGANVRRAGSGTLGLSICGRRPDRCLLRAPYEFLGRARAVAGGGSRRLDQQLPGQGWSATGNPVLACTPELSDAVMLATGVGKEPV